MPNHLINETSPYLLQHAHNPVEWFPWGDEALAKAKKENKPVLVSIGYAACHWCHVMERESFEDPATALFMNENFVNIKIDREERPDLDHIYMDAVQAMTGSGGWPLNVFLTPEAKPFYGGTYYPPARAFNRPSWMETLKGIKDAFEERRHEIDSQAENLVEHIKQSNLFGLNKSSIEPLSPERLAEAENNVLSQSDTTWGGFGRAPKFPQTFAIQFLLRKKTEGMKQALFSLDKMISGGIYDQLGGGFARYSTDTEWLVPHFEKMLYDNALLVAVLSEAFQITGDERYSKTIEETCGFIERELMHPEYGFYSALDADSEGEEGKFYVWEKKEIEDLLGKDAGAFCNYYDITEKGNWEGKNILRVIHYDPVSQQRFYETRTRLLAVRDKRIKPLLDDKIILGWNALMNTAYCKAYSSTGIEKYRQLAISNMEFLLSRFRDKNGNFFHTWKNSAKYPAFLDDLAYLVQALILLQEVTGETEWLEEANAITEMIIGNFSDEEENLFYYTSSGQTDVIVRKKEVYDGAIPSGNSVMAENLHRLSIFFDKKNWRDRAAAMVSSMEQVIIRYPTSFGNWACVLLELLSGTNEIAIVGPGYAKLLEEVLKNHLPHRVIMAAPTTVSSYPLLKDKIATEPASIWLCKDYGCQLPVKTTTELITLINRVG
jgi:uncharacterized protein